MMARLGSSPLQRPKRREVSKAARGGPALELMNISGFSWLPKATERHAVP